MSVSREQLRVALAAFEAAHRVWMDTPVWGPAGRAARAAKDKAMAEYDRLSLMWQQQGGAKGEPVICQTCAVHPVDRFGWCAKCGNYTCLRCGVAMRRRDLLRRSEGFQCPQCNLQRFE